MQNSVFDINKNYILKNNENVITTSSTKKVSKNLNKNQKYLAPNITKKNSDNKINKNKFINSSREKSSNLLFNDDRNNIKTERKFQNFNNSEYYKTEMSYQIINTIYSSKDKKPDCKVYENCLFNKNALNTSLKGSNASKYSNDKQKIKLNLANKFYQKDISQKIDTICILKLYLLIRKVRKEVKTWKYH